MSLISLIQRIPFGNPAARGFWLYSKVPPSFLKKIEQENFRKTVLFVYEHSKFYRRKFDQHKINPKKVTGPENLGDFFTTAEDLREHVDEFVCQRPDTAYETTGTTSKKPKRVYFSRNEVKEAGWAGAVGLWGVGVRPTDRVASAFDCSFWVSGPVLQASCEALGCFHIEAGRIPPSEFYERLKDYGITVIVGDPSWLLGLSEVAEQRGVWPLKLILGGGENMTEGMRCYVESVWKADCLLSYGQTEAFGAIGMESTDKAGYHLNEFHNFFEIVEPDKEGYGELVYTNLNRRVMPLVRYRSGDITRFIDEKTPPPARGWSASGGKGGSAAHFGGGLPGRRIEKLRGRVNEWTATAMGNLAPWMFEPILNSIKGLSSDWQIIIDKDSHKDLIELHVEALDGAVNSLDLKEIIFSNVRKELTEAWKSYELGLFKMDLRLHAKGTLRNGRKLMRLVDKRKF